MRILETSFPAGLFSVAMNSKPRLVLANNVSKHINFPFLNILILKAAKSSLVTLMKPPPN